MPAHTMPPSTPASNTSTTVKRPALASADKATADAKMAPIRYCPSAPMFQTLDRKHTANPSAMISSGVALTMSSDKAYTLLMGSQKNTCKPRTGSLPSALNKAMPISTVISKARIGEA